MTTILIADIGSNWKKHDNDQDNLDCAIAQIKQAKIHGADFAKFQMFTAEELYGEAGEADQYALPRGWIETLADACKNNSIGFMCSAFSVDGYNFINDFVDVHKVASAEATDPYILKTVASFDKPWIVSNGALTDTRFLQGKYPNAMIMHCVGEYPARVENYIDELKNELCYYTVPNISDHTQVHDYTMAYISRLIDAAFVEVHFDAFTGHEKPGPDALVSRNPEQLKQYSDILKAKIKLDKAIFNKNYARKWNEEFGGYYRP